MLQDWRTVRALTSGRNWIVAITCSNAKGNEAQTGRMTLSSSVNLFGGLVKSFVAGEGYACCLAGLSEPFIPDVVEVDNLYLQICSVMIQWEISSEYGAVSFLGKNNETGISDT